MLKTKSECMMAQLQCTSIEVLLLTRYNAPPAAPLNPVILLPTNLDPAIAMVESSAYIAPPDVGSLKWGIKQSVQFCRNAVLKRTMHTAAR